MERSEIWFVVAFGLTFVSAIAGLQEFRASLDPAELGAADIELNASLNPSK